jgi:WD40 repeat protein
LAAGSDNIVRVWDARTGKLRIRLEEPHDGRITTATWIKKDTQILTASYDGLIRVSDAQSGLTLVTLLGHTDWVTGAFVRPQTGSSEEWDMVVSWSRDGSVRLWRIDPETQAAEIYAVLDGQSGPVNGAALNDDGDQVMVWGDDGKVRRYYVYMNDLLDAVCSNNPQVGQSEACRPAQE